jgi:hypothetical protein
MKDKTTKTLFTKEFIDNLKFLIENINIEEAYRETVMPRPTFDDPYDYTCDEELERLAEKFEDLFPEVNQQINDYFNTDFKELYDFLDKNQNTNRCNLEAELIECLEDYMAD